MRSFSFSIYLFFVLIENVSLLLYFENVSDSIADSKGTKNIVKVFEEGIPILISFEEEIFFGFKYSNYGFTYLNF